MLKARGCQKFRFALFLPPVFATLSVKTMRIRVLSILLIFSALGCSNVALQNPKIPDRKYSDEENQVMLERVNSLAGKGCLNHFVSDYQKSLYEYCKATDGGKSIGGGCHHVAYAWSITSSV